MGPAERACARATRARAGRWFRARCHSTAADMAQGRSDYFAARASSSPKEEPPALGRCVNTSKPSRRRELRRARVHALASGASTCMHGAGVLWPSSAADSRRPFHTSQARSHAMRRSHGARLSACTAVLPPVDSTAALPPVDSTGPSCKRRPTELPRASRACVRAAPLCAERLRARCTSRVYSATAHASAGPGKQ